MKQTISFILLLALLVNLMGYFVIFQCSRMVLRNEMADMIRSGTCSGKFETIRIARADMGKECTFQDENEICCNGVLYDVVKTSRDHDSVSFTCVRDDREQNLVARFSLYFHQSEAFRESKKAQPILALMHHLILQAMIQKTLTLRSFISRDFTFPVPDLPVSTVYLPVSAPPPKT